MEENEGLPATQESAATPKEITRGLRAEGHQSLMEAILAQYGGSVTNLKRSNGRPGTLEYFRIENIRYVPQAAEIGMVATEHFDRLGYNGKRISSGHYSFVHVNGKPTFNLEIMTRNRSLTVRLAKNPTSA